MEHDEFDDPILEVVVSVQRSDRTPRRVASGHAALTDQRSSALGDRRLLDVPIDRQEFVASSSTSSANARRPGHLPEHPKDEPQGARVPKDSDEEVADALVHVGLVGPLGSADEIELDRADQEAGAVRSARERVDPNGTPSRHSDGDTDAERIDASPTRFAPRILEPVIT